MLPELDLGGGHGIAYRPGEEALDLTALARKVRAELTDACAAAGLPVPRLIIEPGRAIVGPAGIAVYRVLAVKKTGDHTFVAVDVLGEPAVNVVQLNAALDRTHPERGA